MPRYNFECSGCQKVTQITAKISEFDGLKHTPPSCTLCNAGVLSPVILSCPMMLVPFNMKTESMYTGQAKIDAIEKYRGYKDPFKQ